MDKATKSNQLKLYPYADIDFSDPVWMQYHCTECDWSYKFQKKSQDAWCAHFDECHPELVTTFG